MSARIWPGQPFPLGATYDGAGTNFSLFSEVATRVELCLFDAQGRETHYDLPERDVFCWHGYVPDVAPGQRYGFRVHGPWDPARGHRCNPAKLLIDPYARALDGDVGWSPAVFAYRFGAEDERNDDDSAPNIPKGIVTNPYFDWRDDRPPRRPLHETVIYEVHVRGLTMQHPAVPEDLRGTYAGLAHPAVIDHLKKLGITAVELMPVHHFIHDQHLLDRGLRNYWGYNSIAYFAPHAAYARRAGGHQVEEFKAMVCALHAAGIEVILDVVYNHTGEGNHLGPTLSLRGIDNHAYYRVSAESPRHYVDYTGCGNSLNVRHPRVLALIMDSLRYWVLEMHVDGFRFDLAAALARELHDVDRLSAFFDIIEQDPVLSRVKLIAEPWDIGHGGYQVGNFPVLWSEWNGKYRDQVREYWKGDDQTLADFAQRFTGSSDLYAEDGRKPIASINFVTAHDGFTLRDLVSYDHKHNEANGEENRDGESHNRSWNCGAEGPTADPAVIALRRRQQRNFLATLMLSQGVPMLLGGDEIGRTQGGNNNAYCQDSPISWYDWSAIDEELLQLTQWLIRFRADHPVFRKRRWFHGHALLGSGVRDIAWLKPDATPMTDADWNHGFGKALVVFLNGQEILSPGPRGERIVDDSFLLFFNAHYERLRFTIPDAPWGGRWAKVLDTRDALPPDQPDVVLGGGSTIEAEARSLIVAKRLDAAPA